MSVFLSRAAESLHFAVRPLIIFKYLGLLFLPLAALTLVPALVSAASGNLDVAGRYGVVIAGLVIVGWPCSRLRCTASIQDNEALVISALMFVLPPALMTFPMTAYGIAPLDALFESVSGVTTTGLSSLESVESMPRAFLFARAWLQWIGGLGVIVLALAMLIRPGVAAKRMGFDDPESDDIAGGTRAHAKRVLVIYSVITLAGGLVLWVLGASVFDAIVHIMASVSTGGFSPFDDSLAGLGSPWLRAAVTFFCVAGAVPFAWYYRGAYRRPITLIRDVQIRGLLTVSLLVILLLMILSIREGTAPMHALGHASLMGLSAQTTAGFSSLSVSDLSDLAKLALVCSMVIGGGLGSTAGGLKILRFLLVVRVLGAILQEASLPRAGRVPLSLGDHRIHPAETRGVVALVAAFVGVILVSWMIFVGYGYDPLDALFEVVSATATAGLSTGITGPGLEPVLKGVLCVDMIMGRVEILAMIILFYPPTWIGKRSSSR